MSNGSSINIAATILTSVLTSALVTGGILYFTGNLSFSNGAAASVQEPKPAVSQTVETPAVKGLTTETAADVLKGRGLRLVVQEERADEEVPVGQICEQNPLPGSMLDAGASVTVVVSTGPNLVNVPDVAGKTLDEARKVLTDAGFSVGEVNEVDTGTPGEVTGTMPAGGSLADMAIPVEISVTGAATVPKVVGMGIAKAKKTLTDAGFKVGKIRRGYSDYLDYNAVMAQEPKADETAAAGTEVNLTVNSD